ncbi:MAG: heavy-metal-associated domain-containing protein [Dethiobacteria bacterium]|nr:heavy-metal-associated domain-containing protein [Bacillota bacterium]
MTAPEINEETIEIKIAGMSCNHCVQHVEKALLQTKGVSSARVDLASETAHVKYNASELSVEDLLKVIEDTGYEAVSAG